MKSEEEFDDIIRRKAEGAEVPFNESDWDKAAGMIDASRKLAGAALRRRMTVAAVALFLLCGSIAVFTLGHGTETISESSIAQLKEQNAATEESQVSPGQTPAPQTKDHVPSAELTPATSDDAAKSHAAGQDNAQTVSVLPPSANDRQTKRSHATAGQSGIAADDKTADDDASATKQPASDEPQTHSGADVPSLQENSAGGNSTPENNSAGSNAAGGNAVGNNTAGNDPAGSNVAGSAPEVPGENTEKSAPEVNAQPGTPEFIFLASLMPATSDDREAASSLNISEQNDPDYFSKHGPRKLHYLLADAGAGYSAGWQTPAVQDGAGMNWYAGLTYGRYVSRRMSISLGTEIFNISNIRTPFYQYRTSDYDFFVRTGTTQVITNDLYLVALPLKLHFSPARAHDLSLGFTAAYIFQAANTVRTMPPGNEGSVTTIKTTGVYEGIGQLNFALNAGYRIRMGRRISLSAEAVYFLSDIFTNNSFASNSEKPLMIRLGVGYTLFNK